MKKILLIMLLFFSALLFVGCDIEQALTNKSNDKQNTEEDTNKENNNSDNNTENIDTNDDSKIIESLSRSPISIARLFYSNPVISRLKISGDTILSFNDEKLIIDDEEYKPEIKIFDESFIRIDDENIKNMFSFPLEGTFAKADKERCYCILEGNDGILYLLECAAINSEFYECGILYGYELINKTDRLYYYQALYTLDDKQYGRLISSSESREDAIRVCKRHFTDLRYSGYENVVTECSVIYESDILYGLNVKWHTTHAGDYEENVISIKKSVADITVRNVVYGDEESFVMHTDDLEKIDKVIGYLYYNRYHLGNSIMKCFLLEDDNQIIVDIYCCHNSGMDFGMTGQYITYFKVTITVSKSTGEIILNKEEILKKKYVEMPGLNLNYNFTNDCVLVVVKREYSGINKEWSLDFFGDLPIKEVKDLTHRDNPDSVSNPSEFKQILKIVLKEPSYEGVLELIEELKKFDEFESAEPDYIGTWD